MVWRPVSLEARFRLKRGSLHLDLELQAEPTEVVAVVGPNGSGKTTLLRALAGLTAIDSGRVRLDDVILEDAALGIRLSPERRPVAVVFQDYLLFPHLSAVDNVAYGLRARGLGRGRDGRRLAMGWLARVGVAEQADLHPGKLSGGQAQRVALARALATNPRLLLLDEPLAAIDVAAKSALRRDLRAQLAGATGTRIVVTHDPLDALALADRLVVLEDGMITQQGRLADVAARPRSEWVAQLVGVNLYRGTCGEGSLVLPDGQRLMVVSGVTGAAFGLVHPRFVSVHRSRPQGSARNTWSGEISGIDLAGDRVRVQVAGAPSVVAEITPQAAAELRLTEGGRVWVTVKATAVDVYAA
jgi:molybdate transport system ATP-binding protein